MTNDEQLTAAIATSFQVPPTRAVLIDMFISLLEGELKSQIQTIARAQLIADGWVSGGG